MKKIYAVCELVDGNIESTIYFEDKKDAEYFCQLKADKNDRYHFWFKEERVLFDNLEDYKESKNNYLEELKFAIDGLKDSIKRIKTNKEKFTIFFDKSFYKDFSLEDFKNVLTGDNYKECIIESDDYVTLLGEFKGITRKMTEEDLPLVKNEYEEVKQMLKYMEKRLTNYKREYVGLLYGKKVDKQEQTLEK